MAPTGIAKQVHSIMALMVMKVNPHISHTTPSGTRRTFEVWVTHHVQRVEQLEAGGGGGGVLVGGGKRENDAVIFEKMWGQ
jgi:hypothetical protein